MEPIDRVHTELLPMWILSTSSAAGETDEDEAFRELMAALEDSRADALPGIAERLRGAVRRGETGEEFGDLLAEWNEALDAEGIPFVVRGGALVTPKGPQHFVTAARTLYDLPIGVGETSARIRVVERVDGTNVRESVLGETGELVEGGLVLSDRVLEFATDRVWSVLDEDATMPGWATAFAAGVRDEVRRDLPPDVHALLERTAAARMKAVEATLSIQARRPCSGFILRDLGWNGWAEKDLESLKRYIEHGDCPKVYEVEYEAIRDFSRTARATDGLEEALAALLAWSMRPIALHEGRHAADAAIAGALADPVPCSLCTGLTDRERIELSAYTAQFAWTGAPATSTYQACLAIGGRGGSHRGAIGFLFEQLDADCILGLPSVEDLRAFETRAFDRDAAVVLPPSFPDRVSLPPRAKLATDR